MSRSVLQDLSTGQARLEDGPQPSVPASSLLIATRASIVSPGTERMLADFGRASLIGKARSQPDRVGEALEKVRTDGLAATVQAVRAKLAQPLTLGYSSAGVVIEVGPNVRHISVGDRVATAGPHAEVAAVPANLAAAVPDGTSWNDAAFATLASVSLQGLRLAAPTVGERFVVTGLGLVGLIAVQLLTAQGCSVMGIDPNPERRARAEAAGARTVDPSQDVLAVAADFSRGLGVDGVLICASTASSEPVHQAAQMCRQRGRIVLVGVTGLELQRSDFYEKELTFQVSASYGPGRYDPSYEDDGVDYPAGLVRWTAGRNMDAVLGLIASGKLDVASLVTHEYPFDEAPQAYDTLVDDSAALGIILKYPAPDLSPVSPLLRRRIDVTPATRTPSSGCDVGILGAGSFASQVLIPAIVASGAGLHTVVSSGGTSAGVAARKFAARRASSDPADILGEREIDAVVVATRHDSHARYAEEALRAGKHVFVEKPIAITQDELSSLRDCVEELADSGDLPLLMVGFNRRFAPISVRMRDLLASQRVPKALSLTMNAGALPTSHWTQDRTVGGGRIVGEASHMIDLARFLVGAPITDVRTNLMDASGPADTASISLAFEDGSIAVVNYFANGSKRYPKERIEAFSGGRVLVNQNFRSLKAYGWPKVRTMRLRSQDKGHAAGMAAFVNAIRHGAPAPIALDEILEVADASLRAAGLD